jgi:hypothetical protein
VDWMSQLLEAAPQVGVSLGAGSAPFVGAILWGKLITLRHHNEALSEKDKQIAEVKANAKEREERADAAVAKLNEVTGEFGATMVHMLRSFPQPDGVETSA